MDTTSTMPAVPAAPNYAAIKEKQQASWASGNYANVGVSLVLMAEQLAEAMDLHSGWKVLDVAAGSGNSSLAAARRGCRVTSTDFVASLLETGRGRADAEGLKLDFQVADAEALPFPDASFDAVLSTVGVMFTPNQAQSAAEMMRVCKPGGVIGLACWTPPSFVGKVFGIIGKYLPPPAGLRPPSQWGTEARLRELFPGVQSMTVVTRDFNFRSLSPEHWLEHFKTFYGPMFRTYAAIDAEAQKGLTADLLALAHSMNRATDGTLILPSQYVEAVLIR